MRIIGTEDMDDISGTDDKDVIKGRDGDDTIRGGEGDDRILGQAGFDNIYGEDDNDSLFGGTQNDNVYGGNGNDLLFGDDGDSARNDFGSDNLRGGRGADILVQGDGNDAMSGGGGSDTFAFRFSDPMIALAAGTGRSFTAIRDFSTRKDTLTFDVAGVGQDNAGANFVDGGGEDGTPGGSASSFFRGDASGANGEAVVVITDQGFATGTDAALAIDNEQAGDLIVYFNTTVNVASLLVVDGPDVVHSIARFTDIDSLNEFQDTRFTADDFQFV